VNLDDQPTHRFFVRRDGQTAALEAGNNFILYQDRRFRVIRSSLHNEDQDYVVILARETGGLAVAATA